jgi:S-layer homology domain.
MKKGLKSVIVFLFVILAGVVFGGPLQKVEASVSQLKDKNPGDVISFAGMDWIVLEPSSGYVLLEGDLGNKRFSNLDNKFSPNNPDNLAYYLNADWFQAALSERDQIFVQEKEWGIGYSLNENSETVRARVGLISMGEWMQYSSRYSRTSGFLNDPVNTFWTRTPATGNMQYRVGTDSALQAVPLYENSGVRPTLYLIPEIYITPDGHPNRDPNAIAAFEDKTVLKGDSFTLNLSGYFNDPDGDALSYSAVSSDDISVTVSVYGGMLSVFAHRAGEYTVTVTANDQYGGTVQSSFQVTALNREPTAAFTLPVENLFTNGSTFVISGTKTDPDDDETAVRMKVNDGSVHTLAGPPAGTSFNLEFQIADHALKHAGSGMNVPLSDGQHTLHLWVEDEDGSSSTVTAFSFVLDTEPPVITISGVADGQQTANGVTPVISVTDAHGFTYQITLNGDPYTEGTEISEAGTYELKVEAEDEAGNRASKSVTFSIVRSSPVWLPPVPAKSRIVEMTAGDAALIVVLAADSKTENGRIIEEVPLDRQEAEEILEQAASGGLAAIVVRYAGGQEGPADEVVFPLSASALKRFAQARVSVALEAEGAVISIPPESLEGLGARDGDTVFRIVSVRNAGEQERINSRVLASDELRKQARGGTVRIIGRSIIIEANYSNYRTRVMFPLAESVLPSDPDERAAFLRQLAVYIEHGDGEIAVKRGNAVYSAEGEPAGIEVELDKFSTFTVVRMEPAAEQEVNYPAYISGYHDGTFRPSRPVTRAELAAMLSRSLHGDPVNRTGIGTGGGTGSGSTAPYADVAADHWAFEAILRVTAHGLMVGDGTGRFRPDDLVSRAEMAVVAARWKGLPVSAEEAFSDVAGHWAQGYIGAAKKAGIIVGYPDGTYRPGQAVTRAEAVKILNTLFGRPEYVQAGEPTWSDVPRNHWAFGHIESAARSFSANPDNDGR